MNKLYGQIEQANAVIEKLRSLGGPKPETAGRFLARLAEESGMFPVPNLAVEICVKAYLTSKKDLLDQGIKKADVEELAQLSYASHLPMLANADCIRDFIACVVHGMAVGAIPSPQGTRLLYGAQVAHSALPGGKSDAQNASKPHQVHHRQLLQPNLHQLLRANT